MLCSHEISNLIIEERRYASTHRVNVRSGRSGFRL
jgi:hypothetical protein